MDPITQVKKRVSHVETKPTDSEFTVPQEK
jgi:hypothetical protein